MIYDLSTEYDKQRLFTRIVRAAREGKKVEYTEPNLRTPNQNRYMHLLIGVVAMETGNTIAYVKDYYFKRLVNYAVFVVDKKDDILGTVKVLRSTSDLTKEETSECIDRFKRWGEEQGWVMPNAEDKAAMEQIEYELKRVSVYI